MKKTIAVYIIALFLLIFYCYVYAKPLPPQWTVAAQANKDVLLTWKMAEGSVKTIVLRKKEGAGDFEPLSSDALGFYMDKGLSVGIYIYKLQAVDAAGNKSDFSEERYIVVIKPKNLTYSPPEWSEFFVTEKSILIQWEDTCDVPVKKYNLYKKAEGEKELKLYKTLSKKSFKDVEVAVEQKVSYKVCPLDMDLKELECSATKELFVPREKKGDKVISTYDFVVRKTKFDKLLSLADGKPFVNPTDVLVDISGKIYVADTGTGKIHIFRYNGEYERFVGEVVLKDGTVERFENLLGIDVSNGGIIYGVDAYKGIIKGFDQRGVMVVKIDLHDVFAKNDKYNFKKFGLVDISFDNEEKVIYVVDNYNNHIYKLKRDGKLLGVFLDKGQRNGMVQLPTFSYIDKDGNILVSDTMNQRVSVFNKDMLPKLMFGRQGDTLGTFIRPKGIATDKEGNIYVADSFTNSIQVFSSSGVFKYILGDFRGAQIDMATPNGIYVDKKDKIYIVEKLVDRIQIRYLLNDTITKKKAK